MNTSADQRSLKGITILGTAPASLIAGLEDAAEWMKLPAGEIVVERHDPTTDVFFVVKGKVKAIDFIEGRQEIILGEVSRGGSFGELAAIDGQKRAARVVTLEPSLLAKVSGGDFKNLLLQCPEAALALLAQFAGIIRDLTARMTTFSSLTPNQRIYMELLRLAEPNPQGDGSWVIANLPSHGEIASQMGTDREVVALSIGEIARERIVERKHKNLIIRDYARLQLLAGM